ncbi:MAG: PASTA domain-containing protein [Prevotellaceae bacterium]|jgi:cell division protein FtsI (penicillin-binding protein 3)|nr:PASTA domain-containing protein [Prevotellaceae bacterium]
MTTVKNIIRRITLFYLLTVFISLLIIAKIIYLQFFTDLKTHAEKITVKPITAGRGDIYTHDMKLLATSLPVYDIRVDFYAMTENIFDSESKKMTLYRNKLYRELEAEIKKLGLKSEKEIKKRKNELKKRIKENRKEDTIKANELIYNEINGLADSLSSLFKDKPASYYKSFIKDKIQDIIKNKSQKYRNEAIGNRNINYAELERLLKFPVFKLGKGNSGLIHNEKTRRVVIYDPFAIATIGRINSNGEHVSGGIEKSFDEYIRGKDGLQAVNQRDQPLNSKKNTAPEIGCDVVTTLDLNIQEATEKALMQQIYKGNENGISIEGGTAIVMETATGEIRAIANMKRQPNGTYDETYNYALRERSDPGSTFKLASLIALLDDGFVKLDDVINVEADAEKNGKTMTWLYRGYKVRDDHIFGKLSVKKIFANSSNIGIAKLVTKYYGANPQSFFDKLHSIGLFQKSLNLQIDGEAHSYAEMETEKQVNQNLLAPSSYGYYVKFAPVHTLTFYNAVANNGKMVKPKFVKKIIRNGQEIKSYPDKVINERICSEETLSKTREALQGVVDSGTVKKFKDLLGFEFAGKTGTAQRITDKFKKRVRDTVINGIRQQITDSIRVSYYKDASGAAAYQASFVGYIPADRPRYSIIVVLYSPPIKGNFYGSTYAAPIFIEIAQKLYSSDINWHEPVERNRDSLYLPNMKNTLFQQAKTIMSKLDIPVDSDAKSGDWVNVSRNSSKLTATKIQIDESKVPSVINMGLRNAIYLLEKSGLKVTFSGKGKIKRQSIAPGTAVSKDATIHLEMEI